MNLDYTTRVLVIGDDPATSSPLAGFLSDKHYEVISCAGLDSADVALEHWRPHVMVLVPGLETSRHASLEALRRQHPRLPIVVLTFADGPDLLLDLEAFAPALPARPSRDFRSVESAVAAACLLH